MSIKGEINRIKANVTESFNAVKEAGVTVSQTATSDTLPSSIRQIPEAIYAEIDPILDSINGEVI